MLLTTKTRNGIKKHFTDDLNDLTFELKNILVNGSKRGCSGFVRNNANDSIVYLNTEITHNPRIVYEKAGGSLSDPNQGW